jgi:hypothetical protein
MIGRDETEILGKWITSGEGVVGDEACERVHRLTAHYLVKLGISTDGGAWDTLFRDPADGRFWERTYPQGHMQGGGPPALMNLSETDAQGKYPHLFER